VILEQANESSDALVTLAPKVRHLSQMGVPNFRVTLVDQVTILTQT